MEIEYNQRDIAALQAAVYRNPVKVRHEVSKFLSRGIAVYNRGIVRSPWQMGMFFTSGGGGAPVATGNLRDTHRREVSPWQAKIYPTAPYAGYVHEGTRYLHKRPWLDWVQQQSDREI